MRVLIVEDDQDWQASLQDILNRAYCDLKFHTESGFEQAKLRIQSDAFDLIILDLHLPSREPAATDVDAGMRLLREIRQTERNQDCACVVLSAFGTPASTREALTELDVFDFVVKDTFADTDFRSVVRRALFEAASARARELRSGKYLQTFLFTDTHIVLSELIGPNRLQDYVPDNPVHFDAVDLSRRCDELNLFLTPPMQAHIHDRWRREARSIGKALYDALTCEGLFGQRLTAARDMPERGSDLWLCFRGSRKSLNVPFELMFDGREYLGLQHPIYRRVTTGGPTALRKVAPFHRMLDHLSRDQTKLRILLLAANTPPRIDAVDQEVALLQNNLLRQLQRTGIEAQVDAVFSADSTYDRVEQMLRRSRYHIVHYAGHGRFDDEIAEKSSLFFRHGRGCRQMSAAALKDLLQDSDTYILYLSCCLGARNERDLGR